METQEIIDGYMGYVDRIIRLIPYKRLGVWKDFFLNPLATLAKDDVTIGQRMKDVLVSSAIGVALELIILIPIMVVMAVMSAGIGLILIGAVIVLLVLMVLLSPVISFLYSLLHLAVAKVLGGKGDMRKNFSASALPGLSLGVVSLPISILLIPLAWVSFIPFVSICTSVIQIPISMILGLGGLYSLYLQFLAMKETHKLSDIRAAGVVVLPVVIIVMLVVVAAIALYVSMIAWFVSFAAASAAAGTAAGVASGTG
jgi:hypothetical protein